MLSESVDPALSRLRKQAALEEDPKRLRIIAAEILRVTKKKHPPSNPCAGTIRNLRTKLRLSQAQLAARLNCSAMAVSRWERGLQEPPTRCLLEMGIMAGRTHGWTLWNLAGITIGDARLMVNGPA